MMEPVANKTPVSLLHEICTRNNLNPKYELLQVEGAVHEPIFQYRLSLTQNNVGREKTGSGRSKKEAKHNTALAMLIAMDIPLSEIIGDMTGPVGPVEIEDLRTPPDNECGGNPVGLLQELCMKMKLPPPTYDVHSEDGLPHERIFAMACHVGENHVEIGKGKSKKLAKRMAAHVMAVKLRNIPIETSNVHSYEDDDDKISEGLASRNINEDPVEQKTQSSTKGDIEKIARFYQLYEQMVVDKMPALKDQNYLVEDPVKFLEDLNAEDTFKAVFIEFDELSTLETYHSFVQITCEPPAVAFGEGTTKKEAKIDAARNVINYFRELVSVEISNP